LKSPKKDLRLLAEKKTKPKRKSRGLPGLWPAAYAALDILFGLVKLATARRRSHYIEGETTIQQEKENFTPDAIYRLHRVLYKIASRLILAV